VHGSAEDVPLPDASFDLVLSEYGASLWCDPFLWVPEAARLLRPGGQLAFLTNHLLLVLCTEHEDEPVGDLLAVDAFGLHSVRWADGSTEFHLRHGAWIDLLRGHGLVVEALHELQAPAGARTRFDFVTPAWARRWPSEEIWSARKHTA
jgi:SAM-dependent methyltransferase